MLNFSCVAYCYTCRNHCVFRVSVQRLHRNDKIIFDSSPFCLCIVNAVHFKLIPLFYIITYNLLDVELLIFYHPVFCLQVLFFLSCCLFSSIVSDPVIAVGRVRVSVVCANNYFRISWPRYFACLFILTLSRSSFKVNVISHREMLLKWSVSNLLPPLTYWILMSIFLIICHCWRFASVIH